MSIKKVISGILAISVIFAQNCCFALQESDIDYSNDLEQMENLLQGCKKMHIDTKYEELGYNVVKKFNDYLKQDITAGIDDTINEFNKSKVDEISRNTIRSLEQLYDGETTSKTISLPNIKRLSISNRDLTNNGKPVFSFGYGHDAKKILPDINSFNSFGATNTQIEVGAMAMKSFSNPFDEFEPNATDSVMYYDNSVSHSGNYSIKVSNGTEKNPSMYSMFQKEIACEPNSTYTISAWVKYESNNSNGLDLIMRGELWKNPEVRICNNLSGNISQDWQKYEMTLKTEPSQNSFVYNVIVEGKCNFWIDDIQINKEGSNANLFKNGTFDEYDLEENPDSNLNTVILNTIKNAEEKNVGINLLLSPHYFPNGIYHNQTLPLAGVEYANDNEYKGFLNYNVNSDNAQKLLKEYIEHLMNWLNENDCMNAVTSIILSNEPMFDTNWYTDFYTPRFRSFLTERHTSISNLNDKWGTTYSSFDEINMPLATDKASAIVRDWTDFNNKEFISWHKMLRDEVKKYTTKPVSIKEGFLFDTSLEGQADRIKRGTDFEKEAEFLDLTGFDQVDYTKWPMFYLENMMFIDYAYSIIKKPIYNSEVHIVDDAEEEYSDIFANNAYNHIWMTALHGQSMWSTWLWDHNESVEYGALTRPDMIYKLGKTGLDLSRLSKYIEKLRVQNPKVALFYSKTSRLYNEQYMSALYEVYRDLVNNGIRVGFVSEDNLQDLNSYEALILPGVKYTTEHSKYMVNEYIKNGGKVMSVNLLQSKKKVFWWYEYEYQSPMTCNEYNKQILSGITNEKYDVNVNDLANYSNTPNATISDAVKKFIEDNALADVTVKYSDGSDGSDVSGLDWTYVKDGDNIYINVTNPNKNTKNVVFYMDGEPISDLKDVISGENNDQSVVLNAYEPKLLVKTKPVLFNYEIKSQIIEEKTASVTVKVSNATSDKKSGGVIVEAIDANGDVISSARNYLTLDAYKSSEIEFGLLLNRQCDNLRVRITE